MSEPSPPDQVRSRTLLGWAVCVLTAALLLEATAVPASLKPVLDMLEDHLFYGSLALWALWQARRARVSLRTLLGPQPRPEQARAAGVAALLLIVLTFGAFWLQYALLSLVAPEWVSNFLAQDDEPTFVVGAPWLSLSRVLGSVLVGPAVEELLFRGVLLHRWAHKWGAWRAVLATSAVFALLHLDPLGAFAFALIMALLYVWSASLWVPIACHGAYNGVLVLGEAVEPLWGESAESVQPLADLYGSWWMLAVGAVAALVLWRWARARWPGPSWQLPRWD